MEKGEPLPGNYRSSIDKSDTADFQGASSILKAMTGEGFKGQTVTPQMVKSKIIADITKSFIANKGVDNNGKNIPTGGSI